MQLLELQLVCVPHITQLAQLTTDLILVLVRIGAAVQEGGVCTTGATGGEARMKSDASNSMTPHSYMVILLKLWLFLQQRLTVTVMQ